MSSDQSQSSRYGNLADPTFVAHATGADINRVKVYLPRILDELQKRGITDRKSAIAAIATAMVESGRLRYFEEAGYLSPKAQQAYLNTQRYADPDPVTKKRYYGRGFIQLTHKYNYQKYGDILGIDLVHNPERAKDPDVAAPVLAEFFVATGIPQQAQKDNWVGVREKVAGVKKDKKTKKRLLPNGYNEFKRHVDNLSLDKVANQPSQPTQIDQPSASAKAAYSETEAVIAQAQKLEMAGDWTGAHKLINDQIWRISHPRGLIAQLEQENPKGNANTIAYLKRTVERYHQGQLPGSGRAPQPTNTDEPSAGNASEWTDDSDYEEA